MNFPVDWELKERITTFIDFRFANGIQKIRGGDQIGCVTQGLSLWHEGKAEAFGQAGRAGVWKMRAAE